MQYYMEKLVVKQKYDANLLTWWTLCEN